MYMKNRLREFPATQEAHARISSQTSSQHDHCQRPEGVDNPYIAWEEVPLGSDPIRAYQQFLVKKPSPQSTFHNGLEYSPTVGLE